MVESVTSQMSSNMQQLLDVVNKLTASGSPARDDTNISITEIPATIDPTSILRNELLYTAHGSQSSSSESTLASISSNLHGTSSSSSSSISVESSSKIQSPEHKRPRSKKKLPQTINSTPFGFCYGSCSLISTLVSNDDSNYCGFPGSRNAASRQHPENQRTSS
jgi:hypothetical protein